MKFLIETVQNKCGRLGILQKSEKATFKTPLLLHYAKAASIPFLSREVLSLAHMENLAVEVPIDSIHHMEKALKNSKNGLTAFSGLTHNASLCFATVKNPAEESPSGFHDRDRISIFNRAGRKSITADEYMDLIESCIPDVYHPLCDGDTNADSSKKRVIKSVDRSEQFLEKCLSRHKQSERLKNSMFLASIEGGYNLEARKQMINRIKRHSNDIDGYHLDGFHNNGKAVTAIDLNGNNLRGIIESCIEHLPENKPKVMLGPYNPVAILELIQLGIDIFDSSYAYLVTMEHCALTFNIDSNAENNDFDIDFCDEKYKDDFKPILQGCTCSTCLTHSRAYIYHLLNTKELLASILLAIHNTHHFMKFFDEIQLSIKSETLPLLLKLVREQFITRSRFQIKLEQSNKDVNKIDDKKEFDEPKIGIEST